MNDTVRTETRIHELETELQQLKAINQKLLLEGEYANSINNTINDGLLVLDKNLRVKSANATFYHNFQVTVKDTEDVLVYELGNGQWNIPALRLMLENILPQRHEIVDFEVKHDFPDIGLRVMTVNARRVRGEDHGEDFILLIIKDITQLRRLELELEATIARLDFALETGQIGTWELDLQREMLNASDKCKANFGLPPDAELSYSRLFEMMLPEDQGATAAAVQEAIQSHNLYNREYRVVWPDGSLHWINAVGKAIYDDSGQPVNMIGITADITGRKAIEEKLKYSENHFRSLSNSAPVMIAMSNASGIYDFFNREWLTYTGQDADTLPESDYWFSLVHPEDLETLRALEAVSIPERKRYEIEFRLLRGAQYRWVSCTAIPRFNYDNSFAGYTMACIDVHDQRLLSDAMERKVEQRTEALREVNSELTDRNRELEQFAFVTSHDLQEPLRKIRMFISMLLSKNPEANAQTLDYLNKIEVSANRMTGLIQDLLNYSSLQERNRDTLPTDLHAILQEVLADFELLIQEKNVLVLVGKLPTVDAIPVQMRQLFYNLVGNAIKFSSKERRPEIAISSELLPPGRVRALNLSDKMTWYSILISDNGIGFNPAFAEKIFVLFQRLHQRDKYAGNGIGLALCKRIIDNHGGEIIPSGIEGKGASFEILLPGYR